MHTMQPGGYERNIMQCLTLLLSIQSAVTTRHIAVSHTTAAGDVLTFGGASDRILKRLLGFKPFHRRRWIFHWEVENDSMCDKN